MTYTQGYEDGVRATKAEFLKLYKEEQTKTLTNDEIEYLLHESIWALGLNSDCLEQENWDDAITVFRATLRKAQEK